MMRRAAPFLALVLALLPPPARAEDKCSYLAFTDKSELNRNCGVVGVAFNCKSYINNAYKTCESEVAERFVALEKAQKKSPRVQEEIDKARDGIDEILAAENEILRRGGKLYPLLTSELKAPFIAQLKVIANRLADITKSSENEDATESSEEKNGKNRGALKPPEKIVDPVIADDKEKTRKQLIVAAKNFEGMKLEDPVESQKLKLTVAGMYLNGGDAMRAVRVGRDMVKSAPDDANGHAILAQSYMTLGKTEMAEASARRALDLDPKNKSAIETYGYTHALLSKNALKRPNVSTRFEELPDSSGASPKVAAGAKTAPANPVAAAGAAPTTSDSRHALSLDMRRALELRRAGDDMGSLELLTRLIDQDPDNLDARLERSDILLKLGKPEAALADAEAVLAKEPNDPRALRAAAASLFDLGRFAEALAMIDSALAIDPGNGPAHFTRARTLEKLGRIEEAIAAYKRAAELDPVVAVMAEQALKRLAGGSVPPAVSRGLLRGGFMAASVILVLLGLMGGARMVTQRRAAQTASASAVPDSERTFSTGDLIGGQYRISRELGRGGMGLVFEAVDETLKRRVALKQMQAEFRVSAEDTARFLQEARLVAQLRHPNIAEIHAAVDDGGLFLVFELIDGLPLDKLLASGGALKEADARRVVGDLCGALSCAHASRIIHRDLKPANVMRTGSGLHKVMDFGIAHQARSAASTQTSASGTPPYMAPEQVMGTVLPASDLYALAVMTYELLAGTRPFPGPDFLGPKMRGEFALITSLKPGLPPGLDAFFASALAPDPSRRPADAETFRKAFEACWDVRLANTVLS